MGRGDRRSRKGKIWRGSYGKTRPRHGKKPGGAPPVEAPPPAKAPAKKRKTTKTEPS
ncbi:MAG: 30S ribosomal protein THX [Thermoanaerobaculia bacterium]